MYIGFGAGAAAVFILLVANSDRSDQTRIVALALLSGFVWKPIWTSSQVMLMGQEEKKSPIDSPANEVNPSTPDESPVASLSQAFHQFIERFINEREMDQNEFEETVELTVGEPQEFNDQRSFRFAIDTAGPFVVHAQARRVDADLVGTLYRYKDGELEFVDIDDDSGSWFNPRLNLDHVDSGDYLLELKPYQEDVLYGGPVRVLVSRD